MSHRRLTAMQDSVLRMMAKARLRGGEAKDDLLVHLVVWLRTNDIRWTLSAARARVRAVIDSLS